MSTWNVPIDVVKYEERIQALEQQNAQRSQDVQKLVDAARALAAQSKSFVDLAMGRGGNLREDAPRSVRNAQAALAEALKPFEQKPAPQEGRDDAQN